jgi:hypothetical protein
MWRGWGDRLERPCSVRKGPTQDHRDAVTRSAGSDQSS